MGVAKSWDMTEHTYYYIHVEYHPSEDIEHFHHPRKFFYVLLWPTSSSPDPEAGNSSSALCHPVCLSCNLASGQSRITFFFVELLLLHIMLLIHLPVWGFEVIDE